MTAGKKGASGALFFIYKGLTHYNMKWTYYWLKEDYFSKNNSFDEMLDPGNLSKQGKRPYFYLKVAYRGNHFVIPFRSHVNHSWGYHFDQTNKKGAGLDYTKSLIVNDSSYLGKTPIIPKHQHKIIKNNINIIERQFKKYVDGYIRVAIQEKESSVQQFKNSTLQNFHNELGITAAIEKKAELKKRKELQRRRHNEINR
ncbi:type III toxin-antitoxin system TenpIN family toxin [Bacillus subtilis]|uniref:type III toxin-antitoxin system TenpIN family toxin n=1 Tax=Bacillus TaxID=1386 RepID=UPI00084A2220|nr:MULTISPECIES: hypothetical protein [Bacillus]MEC2294240.1 hypothetical protein [Bacillus subtilis]MEC3664995.1 hypothetical protein [Bacillus subtilis]NUF07832.1 hypothetical protein [Bacillus rugosus]ODV48114.1 hypothetical protein BCM26_03980 [Bacillus subtilis]OJH64060.1 hypothetical protein BOH71_06915 [Bacillus subtilis]